MMPPVAGTLASWWGFAEADPVILGIAVAAVAALAFTYLGLRAVRGRRDRASGATR